MVQQIEPLFVNFEAMNINLPMVILVPMIIIFAIAGTIAFIKLIQGLIKLLFGKKGKKIIDDLNNFNMNVESRTDNLRKDFHFSEDNQS
ncbi:hypothetical protein A5868_001382 [Enterococcus sp. 12F9_DIV0723]|uniref:hypothetical protein n=1 Tax=Enterococcus sp. 12F9_DIV0723 TaxID=1834169 RepID=UPI000B3ECE43|nr:hypothetical protein [Enterococcus sp. 12F9_DIV0723]OUZ16461.1 hypothetical protein A5868_001382 [Enterococcus sp. 12F9_DIV0723]